MMRNVFLFILFLICKTGDCQYLDFSILGKTIHYSDTLKNAIKFKNIDEALLHPENVIFLDLFVEASGKNYDEFIVHQSSFKNLRKLVIINSLEKTHWPVVPDFSNFKFLEFLQVFCLSEINTSQFENLTNLKFLELHSCGIRTFPASILKLKKLECLNLSLNFLSKLPSEMNNLVSLRELELTNNSISGKT
jgi:Leucine-rich repeat (LRR) protein